MMEQNRIRKKKTKAGLSPITPEAHYRCRTRINDLADLLKLDECRPYSKRTSRLPCVCAGVSFRHW